MAKLQQHPVTSRHISKHLAQTQCLWHHSREHDFLLGTLNIWNRSKRQRFQGVAYLIVVKSVCMGESTSFAKRRYCVWVNGSESWSTRTKHYFLNNYLHFSSRKNNMDEYFSLEKKNNINNFLGKYFLIFLRFGSWINLPFVRSKGILEYALCKQW